MQDNETDGVTIRTRSQARMCWLRRWLKGLLPGRSLELALFLWMAAVVAGIILIFVPLGLNTATRSARQVLKDRLALTTVAAKNVDTIMQLIVGNLADEATRFVFDPSVGVTAEHKLNLQWASQHLGPFKSRLSLLDNSGIVRWTEPYDFSLVESSQATRPFIQDALAKRQTAISNLVDTGSGSRLISLVAPVADAKGVFSGLLMEDINLSADAAEQLIPPLGIGSRGYVQLIDKEGNVLVSTKRPDDVPVSYDRAAHLSDLALAAQPAIGKCYNCHEGPGNVQKELETIAYYPLAAAPWGVIVREASSEIMAGASRLYAEFVLAGLLVLFVALSVLLIGMRWIFNPLRGLTVAAARISHGDFDVVVPKARRNEVGQLSESFEQMRVKIKALLEEERRWRERLELQVGTATRDLASLCDVSQAVNRNALNLDRLLAEVLGRTVEAIKPADAGILFLLKNGTSLVPAASAGYSMKELSRVVLRLGEGMAGQALQQGVVICNSMSSIAAARNTPTGRAMARLEKVIASRAPARSAVALPLTYGGQTEGVLLVLSHIREHAFSTAHVSLARSVADQVAVGLVNARLYAELQRREASRSDLVRKLINAQEEERRRVARELHDEAGQALTAVMMSASRAEQSLPVEMTESKERLIEARSRAAQALNDVRRLMFDLRPQVLDDLGLQPALRWFVKNRLQSASIDSRLEITGIAERLTSQVEVTVFRVVQEALTNIIRHSEATRVTVRLTLQDSVVYGEIQDDGMGFEVAKVMAGQEQQEGWGLRGMEERVHLLGGRLSISSKPGKGTRIRFQIPLGSSAPTPPTADHEVGENPATDGALPY